MGEGPARTGQKAKSRVRYYAAIAAAAVTGAGVAVGRHGGRCERGAERRQRGDHPGDERSKQLAITRQRPRRRSSTWW